VEINDALTFAAGNDRTVLVTRRRDGSLQMSPVNSGVVDGKVVISSRDGLAKVANVRRNPAVSLLIFTDAFFGSWVQIDGGAAIVDQPEALDLLDRVYRAIAGEHPDWADYRRAMIQDKRVVISVTPERASGQLA
jgi:PPOX class probable F420-dependent enzyme